MKRKIKLTRHFSRSIDSLLKKGTLLQDDFDVFMRQLAEHPEMGDLIPGLGGARKIRLKSATKGKRGSFRVCYYFFIANDEIYLVEIYAKNFQEDLTNKEKKNIRQLISIIKGAK